MQLSHELGIAVERTGDVSWIFLGTDLQSQFQASRYHIEFVGADGGILRIPSIAFEIIADFESPSLRFVARYRRASIRSFHHNWQQVFQVRFKKRSAATQRDVRFTPESGHMRCN